MASKTITVGSAVGLHARPAGIIAEAAERYDDEIALAFGGSTVEADSAMMIMSLGAMKGDEVVVSSEDAQAVSEIAALLESDLDA